MGRAGRQWKPQGLYHVFSRGSDRRPIVIDDRDLADLEHLLLDALVVTGVEALAWAFMPNHWQACSDARTTSEGCHG